MSKSERSTGTGSHGLPASIQKAGVLKIATSLQWPPYDYEGSDGKPVGLDIEIITAIAKELGVRPQFSDVGFPSIVPGVGNGRFDVGVNQMADTAERRKTVQFVNYLESSLIVLARKGGPKLDPQNLCGVKLAVTEGSSQILDAERISKQCVKDGKKAIDFVTLKNSATTILAVSNGRADGFLSDKAVGVYQAKTSSKNLKVVPGNVPGTPHHTGIVVGKDDTPLAKAVQHALQALMDNGQYAKILEKYGISDNAVDKATINGRA